MVRMKITLLMCLYFSNMQMESALTTETTSVFVTTKKTSKYMSTATTVQTTLTTAAPDCNVTDFPEKPCTLNGDDIVCQKGNVTKYEFTITPYLSNSMDDSKVNFSKPVPGLTYHISGCRRKSVECKEECRSWPIERSPYIDKDILANVTTSNNSITIHCENWKGKMMNASYRFELSNGELINSYANMSWGEQCLVTFKDLKSGSFYNVTVFGITLNHKNSSKVSRILVTEPSNINLMCKEKNLNNLTIRVHDTIEKSTNYSKSYIVHYNSVTKNTESNPVILEKLDADTPYNVSVQVELKELNLTFGERFKVSSKNHTIECRTALQLPRKITCNGDIILIQETSSSSVNISFLNKFDNGHGKVVNLSLEVKKDGQPYHSYQLEVTDPCTKMHYHLKDLPNAEYQLELKAGNRLNQSKTLSLRNFTISSTPRGLIAALAVIIILLIVVIIVLMCLMCRCKPMSSGKTVHMSKNSVNITRFINPNFTLRKISHRLSHHPTIRMPVKVSNFPSHVENMEKDSGLMYSEEFDDLKCIGRNQTAEDALLQCNRAKNRFVNILPYDATRVKLQPIEDEEGSDYINANWIPGYNSKREYIATQGPLTSTMDDFWKLVWEQNCPAIVMLTLLVEKNKIKCEQYWPTESTAYGDLQVTLEDEIITEKWCLRKFKVENTASDESKTVKHFHYLEWPDMNVPETDSMLSFIHFIRENLKDEISSEAPAGPIVVHCSAGVGRSGTFIALETLLNQIQDEEDIDVYGTVMEMRKTRVQMVQTEQQYVFLYRCMKEVIEKSQPPGSPSCNLQIHEADTSNAITNVTSEELDSSSKDALIGNGTQAQDPEKCQTTPPAYVPQNEQNVDGVGVQVKDSGVGTDSHPRTGNQLS